MTKTRATLVAAACGALALCAVQLAQGQSQTFPSSRYATVYANGSVRFDWSAIEHCNDAICKALWAARQEGCK